MEYQIYKLIDPRNNEIKYIGCTKNKLNRRLSGHMVDSRFASQKVLWIAELIKENIKPIIESIEVCDEFNWREREEYWMSQFSNLLNSDRIKPNNSKKQSVVQLSMGGEYIYTHDSIRGAARSVGLRSKTSIIEVLNESKKSAKGCNWIYEHDYLIMKNSQQYG